jgi:hypothetical protein
VVIMTSNIGSEYLVEGVTGDGEIKPEGRSLVMAALRGHFRPEFLYRVDEVVLFAPLSPAQIERIVDLMLADLTDRLAQRNAARRGAARRWRLPKRHVASSPGPGTTRCTVRAPCAGSSPARWRPGSPGPSSPTRCPTGR